MNQPNPPGWEHFWAVYPRKVSKKDALKAFIKLAPNSALIDKIIIAISLQKQTSEWKQDNCAALEVALKILYEETKDYITINNLGNPYHNQSMKLAHEALSGSKMGTLFEALLEEHNANENDTPANHCKRWREAEALRKECGLT